MACSRKKLRISIAIWPSLLLFLSTSIKASCTAFKSVADLPNLRTASRRTRWGNCTTRDFCEGEYNAGSLAIRDVNKTRTKISGDVYLQRRRKSSLASFWMIVCSVRQSRCGELQLAELHCPLAV